MCNFVCCIYKSLSCTESACTCKLNTNCICTCKQIRSLVCQVTVHKTGASKWPGPVNTARHRLLRSSTENLDLIFGLNPKMLSTHHSIDISGIWRHSASCRIRLMMHRQNGLFPLFGHTLVCIDVFKWRFLHKIAPMISGTIAQFLSSVTVMELIVMGLLLCLYFCSNTSGLYFFICGPETFFRLQIICCMNCNYVLEISIKYQTVLIMPLATVRNITIWISLNGVLFPSDVTYLTE